MIAINTAINATPDSIAVCTIADDLPTSDETGLVAEGVYSIGILMCVRCVNIFIVVEELWKGIETALALTLFRSFWIALRSFFG